MLPSLFFWKIAGSATRSTFRPRRFGSSSSISRIFAAVLATSHCTPTSGSPVHPYSSRIMYSFPFSSTAYHPTAKGFEYPQS